MTLVVPFDGSDLAKTALVRAKQFDTVLNVGVTAVTAIPKRNVNYARERDWLGPTEQFNMDKIVSCLNREIKKIAPDVEFHHIITDRTARSGNIAKKIRGYARDVDASIVFIGSENAGRIVSSLTVGSTVATDRAYDTMIISSVQPTKITELEEAVPTEEVIS